MPTLYSAWGKLKIKLLDNLMEGVASENSIQIEVIDSDTGLQRTLPDGTIIPITIDPKNTKGKGAEFTLFTVTGTSGTVTTGNFIARGIDPDATYAITGNTSLAKQWEAGTIGGDTTNFLNHNRVKAVLEGLVNTGGANFRVGDAVDEDITYWFYNGTATPPYIKFDTSEGVIVVSHNGISEITITGPGGTYGASGWITIVANVISGVLATDPGLEDVSGLRVKLNGSSLTRGADGMSVTWPFPVSACLPIAGDAAPSGWLLCNGSSYDMDTYGDLADEIRDLHGTDAGATVTADNTTDFLTDTSHGLSNGNRIVLTNSGGALPAELAVNTIYFVINKTDDTFQVSLTSGGAAINFTDDGTGTHKWHNAFSVPDMRGRAVIGLDNMGGSSANTIVAAFADTVGGTGGTETHTLTVDEMPAHTHTINLAAEYGGSASGSVAQTPSANPDISTASAGGGSEHANVQPSIALNWIIKY